MSNLIYQWKRLIETNNEKMYSKWCWLTYIHKWPNIGNALRGLFTGTQSEKDGSNKARVSSHMSLGVISTKQMEVLREDGHCQSKKLFKR